MDSQYKVTHAAASVADYGIQRTDQDKQERHVRVTLQEVQVRGKRARSPNPWSKSKIVSDKTIGHYTKTCERHAVTECQVDMVQNLRQLSQLETCLQSNTLWNTDFEDTDYTDESDHDFKWQIQQAELDSDSAHAEYLRRVESSDDATDFGFLL